MLRLYLLAGGDNRQSRAVTMTIPQLDNPVELLTSEEIIQRLAADSALRRVAVTCVLPAIRYGAQWRFRRCDLESWIARQKES